ncbi:hypothetical protein HAX54_042203 [Datura stramonium]|uniref:Uncharacterized protein n=1 Tax=Datura stramonium TaxID=4076 RepID=A0ABS8SLY6_DATST|nr:hypothetical protein [Datura stramonium]
MAKITQNHTQAVSGWAALDSSGKITPYVFNRRENGVNDVTIKILYCGICHTDLHYAKNDWGITMYPVVSRHEITGIVLEVGSNVRNFKIGDKSCSTYNGVFWDGSITYGGYSNMLVADYRFVVVVPRTYQWTEQHHCYVQENEAKTKLGADDFIVSSDAQQMKSRQKTLDFILDTVSANHSLGPYLELLKVKGTFVIVGAPDKPVGLPAFPLIFGKRTVKGSMIGSIKETQEMIDICGKYNIMCDIEIITPDRINEAYDRIEKNDIKYRFVIDIAAHSSKL